jgi:hypothetical protein
MDAPIRSPPPETSPAAIASKTEKGKPMILQPVEYDVANLLHSDNAVAVCQLDGQKLKDMTLTIRDRGWGLVVVEATSGAHWLIFAASPTHQGNLVGDVRRWTRELGYEFFVRLSGEDWPTPKRNTFTLPDGRDIEICNVLTRAGNFTHSGLPMQKVLPDGYVTL